MEDRETARMRKYGESKTTRIMMATVPHVTSGLGLNKFQADGFLLTRVYVWRNIEARSYNHFCSGKEVILHILRLCFIALGIQHAMRLRHIVLSCVACLAVQYFSTLSHKRHDFREKKNSCWTYIVCFDFLYNFYLKYFSFWQELSEVLS